MVNVLVFDMGGVLYDFQGDRLIARTSRRKRRWRSEEVQERWLPLVRAFETGTHGEAEFATAVVHAYDLALTPHEFSSAFRDAAVGFYEGALELVRGLSERHRLHSLSNSNGLQWPNVLRDLGAADPFHAHHPSHLSGFHKPDPRAFAAIAATLEPGQLCYFFDDRADNVDAAAELGWSAHRVRGITEVQRVCQELGLL